MPKTYTMYLRGAGFHESSFEPALCETHAELLAKVSELLARNPACEQVDVFFGNDALFSVRQTRRS